MSYPFLSCADAQRFEWCLRTLQTHGIENWALTGGVAIEIHRAKLSRDLVIRPFNDIDFVTMSFDQIPDTLADDFMFLHVHPFEPHGRTLCQFVSSATATRIDVFRASANVMKRTVNFQLSSGTLRVLAISDLIAHIARLMLNLAAGIPTGSKHARDFLDLLRLSEPLEVQRAWEDHRRFTDPVRFDDAAATIRDLIACRPDLLIIAKYSQNPAQQCVRCIPSGRFQLADKRAILAVLGYC